MKKPVEMPRGIRVVADETVPAGGPAAPYRLSVAAHDAPVAGEHG